MAQFQYKARDGQGRLSSGTVAAPSASQAGVILRGQGMFVIAVQEAVDKAAKASRSKPKPQAAPQSISTSVDKPADDDDEWQPTVGRQKIRRTDVITFAHQLAVMVDTGVSLSEALSCCADQSESEGFKKVMYGHLYRTTPIRMTTTFVMEKKWVVPKWMYPKDYFPPYLSGAG